MIGVIGRVLPAPVHTEESFGDGDDSARRDLFPEEAAVVAKAVPKRQREFAGVRACARRALARLGVPPVPLLPGHRGAPRWPDGVVGSMTHCQGYRAAAVARAADVTGLGIDAEPDGPLPEGVLETVALPAERAQLDELATARPGVNFDRLLFSAKESVFKTWYPLASRELGFSEAEITVDPGDGTFHARLLVEGPVLDGGPLRGFEGRWAAQDGLIVTACLVGEAQPPGTTAAADRGAARPRPAAR